MATAARHRHEYALFDLTNSKTPESLNDIALQSQFQTQFEYFTPLGIMCSNVVHPFRSKFSDHCFFSGFTAQEIECLLLISLVLMLFVDFCEQAFSDLFCVWLLFIPGSKATAMECLEAIASGLYSELFTILISLINRLVFLIQ